MRQFVVPIAAAALALGTFTVIGCSSDSDTGQGTDSSMRSNRDTRTDQSTGNYNGGAYSSQGTNARDNPSATPNSSGSYNNNGYNNNGSSNSGSSGTGSSGTGSSGTSGTSGTGTSGSSGSSGAGAGGSGGGR